MNRSTIVRRGLATGIAGAGLAVGALGIASAADTSTASPSSATAVQQHGDRERGPGGGRGMGGPELAEALGVSEAELRSALESVREQLEPSRSDRSAPPTEEEREERRDQTAEALAEELDLSAAEVTEAFEELHEAGAVERRTALADRLDEAVAEGDLTGDDRASVLKAFDAGVLGGGHKGGHGTR